MFIAMKTEDGTLKGKISFYCKSLGVTRQGFHNYLKYKDKPWKYQSLADAMLDICIFFSLNACKAPTAAELGQVWTPFSDNMKLLLKGSISAQDAAKNIDKQVKTGISLMNSGK